MFAVENIFRTARNVLKVTSVYTWNALETYGPKVVEEKNKIMELAKNTLEKAGTSNIAQNLHVAKEYWKLEMAPPTVNDVQRLKDDIALAKDFIKGGCWKFMTVKQAWLLFLVGLEVLLWFFLGETIGKFHIVGYKV